jgi:hypothetical protein
MMRAMVASGRVLYCMIRRTLWPATDRCEADDELYPTALAAPADCRRRPGTSSSMGVARSHLPPVGGPRPPPTGGGPPTVIPLNAARRCADPARLPWRWLSPRPAALARPQPRLMLSIHLSSKIRPSRLVLLLLSDLGLPHRPIFRSKPPASSQIWEALYMEDAATCGCRRTRARGQKRPPPHNIRTKRDQDESRLASGAACCAARRIHSRLSGPQTVRAHPPSQNKAPPSHTRAGAG